MYKPAVTIAIPPTMASTLCHRGKFSTKIVAVPPMMDVRRTLRASPSLIKVSANFSIVLFLSYILHDDTDFKAENQLHKNT